MASPLIRSCRGFSAAQVSISIQSPFSLLPQRLRSPSCNPARGNVLGALTPFQVSADSVWIFPPASHPAAPRSRHSPPGAAKAPLRIFLPLLSPPHLPVILCLLQNSQILSVAGPGFAAGSKGDRSSLCSCSPSLLTNPAALPSGANSTRVGSDSAPRSWESVGMRRVSQWEFGERGEGGNNKNPVRFKGP